MILESSHAMLWLVSHTSSAKAVKIRNSPLMFLQTCAKLAFCLTQIYFLAITAWYRVHSMCFPISRNAILGFRKNMSQRPKGFQGNLDTTTIKNFPDWFRNSLNCTGLLQNLSQRNYPLESGNQSRLDVLNNHREKFK